MRSVLVTGASGGLGGEVVRRLEREYRVIAPARDLLDVTSEDSVARFFAAQEELYGVVHLVGGWSGGRIDETSLPTWQRMLTLNVTAAFLTVREAARTMGGPGRIVAISSAATLDLEAGSVAYTVAKSALNALVQALAVELRDRSVTVNALLPTGIATDAMLAAGGDRSNLVEPAEIAEVIAFLLSDRAGAITGTLLPMQPGVARAEV